jgi:hypothetical protein
VSASLEKEESTFGIMDYWFQRMDVDLKKFACLA